MADLYSYKHNPSPYPMNLYPPDQQQQQQDIDDDRDDHDQQRHADSPKSDTKPQATFLTKLYALLERPENHHMIRWDAAGDHIIVERPEQLALHVLPSVYRQSRFASFSRQLNIYGFMRKVNLRNVDPAIDDPDASTWSHPTLNRHSPAEVVANFKRRVPPRLPKGPRKPRTDGEPVLPVPRSAATIGTVPLTVPSQVPYKTNRPRGFSAPGSFTPIAPGGGPSQWGPSPYGRPSLPPLTVPNDPSHGPSMFHPMHTSQDDTPQQTAFHTSYQGPGMHPAPRDGVYGMQSSYSYPSDSQHSWGFQSQINLNASSPSSLSSLLNPTVPTQSYGHHSSRPTISTQLSPVASYPSPFASVPLHNTPSGSSMSPDSRPTTGYSTSYDDSNSMDCSRPGTGNRPLTPASVISGGGGRPGSSHKSSAAALACGVGAQQGLSIRRGRRHSQAVNPYPSPYDHTQDARPLTAPDGLPRGKSLIQLPSVESYCFNPAQAEFAYSAGGPALGSTSSVDSMSDSAWMAPGANQSVRPSTAHSTMSAQSHSSASGANTPPMDAPFEDSDISRFSPTFGYIALRDVQPVIDYVKTQAC